MSDESPPKFSFVIPVFNEQDSLIELHKQLDAVSGSLVPVLEAMDLILTVVAYCVAM